MYATVRRFEGVTDTGEVCRRVDEGFVPIVRKIPGFVGYTVVDGGDGLLVTIGVFQDQAGAEESNNRSREWLQQENLGSLVPNRPQITAGEVTIHATT